MDKSLLRLMSALRDAEDAERDELYQVYRERRAADPDFQIATAAYQQGMRLSNWECLFLVDTDNEIQGRIGEKTFYFADNTNTRVEEFLEASGLTDEQASFLSEICEEEGWDPRYPFRN